jgi:hypothetical protein
MSSSIRRVVCVLITLLALSLPLAAQAGPDRGERAAQGFLSILWERLTAPFTVLWSADTTDTSGQTDPAGTITPTPGSEVLPDGRSVIDPLG